MIHDKKILAIIPARGGSKGVPGKNIKRFAGKPLIGWTIEAALNSRYIDRVIVSTDDIEIARVAEQFNVPIPYIRDKKYATDQAEASLPVLEAIENIPGYDQIILLQPTSPLRDTSDIDTAIELFEEYRPYSVVSVTPNAKPFEWLLTMNQDNIISSMTDKITSSRQQSQPLYAFNGALYIVSTADFVKHQKFISKDSYGYTMPPEKSIDIDTTFDFDLAEYLMLKATDKLKNKDC